jgi:hypothetical protein
MGNILKRTPKHILTETNTLYYLILNSIEKKIITGELYKNKLGRTKFLILWDGYPFGIIISYPREENDNTNMYGWTIKTSLWSVSKNKKVYHNGLRYTTSRRFYSPEELIIEINRVYNAITSGSSISYV